MLHRFSLLLTLLLLSLSVCSQSAITLRRTFIDSFKNIITINSSYDVWFTHHKAKPEKDDGDIHCSGYDKKIGMPVVAEIMNAKEEQSAIDILITHEGKGAVNNSKIGITGVWRLWPEHMGSGVPFFQGMKLTKAKIKSKTTNPDHVFEIHPMIKIENIDLISSLRNIGPDYEPFESRYVFDKLKKKAFTITSAKKTITFQTSQVGYNYINLWIRIDSLWEVDDGAFAYCTILDSGFDPAADQVDDKTVSKKTRIAFVKDSGPYNQAIQKGVGGFMHILGTPRINLAILSWREWASKKRPEVLNRKLPFEIIADGLIE